MTDTELADLSRLATEAAFSRLTAESVLVLDEEGLRVADTSWDADEEQAERFAAYLAGAANAVPCLLAQVEQSKAEEARLRKAVSQEFHDIEQTLGKALLYPPLYQVASDVDDGTVGVGDHVAATLAAEAANRLNRLRTAAQQALTLLEGAEWGGYSAPSHDLVPTEQRRAVILALHEAMTRERSKPVTELERVRAIVAEVSFPGYCFEVAALSPHGETVAVRVVYDEADVMHGVVEQQQGRWWVINPGWTAGQVVQTCYKALLTSLEHRSREHFAWRGRPILQPHFDLEQLWQLAAAHQHGAAPIRFEAKQE